MSAKQHGSGRVELAKKWRTPGNINRELIKRFLSALDCPRSLAIWMLYASGTKEDHNQLIDLECRPDDYDSSQSFRDAYTATEFLSKCSFLNLGRDTKGVALAKFQEMESRMAEANRTIKSYVVHPDNYPDGARLISQLSYKMSKILGRFNPDEWFDSCGWGPGVSRSLKGADTGPEAKFQHDAGITPQLRSVVGPLLPLVYPTWFNWRSGPDGLASSHFAVKESWQSVGGNAVTTVPKNAKTDRTIAIEPGLNLWFQKGIGAMIRRRLRTIGYDLNSQRRNQELSRLASLTGQLATVDFSAASDSISVELVRAVLPHDWFVALDLCRSHYYDTDEGHFLSSKFSTMGNGFTFELESAIFLCLALCVSEVDGLYSDSIGIYGDDVVIESQYMDRFVTAASLCFFSVNSKKSHSTGYFRESCGDHWYDGVDCKPFYLKDKVYGIAHLYRCSNGIRRLSRRHLAGLGCDVRFKNVVTFLILQAPEPLRLRIPDGIGDVGFLSCFDHAVPSVKKARHGIEGFYVTVYSDRSRRFRRTHSGLLLARLKGGSSDVSLGNNVTLRRVTKCVISDILVPRWTDPGAWY